MMKISYWSDYACPFCYIGETRLKKALQELNMTDYALEMKAFQLDTHAPQKSTGTTLDRAAAKYGLSKEETARQIEAVSQMGQAEGLTFNYADTPFTHTMDAHRLTKYAAEKDTVIADRLSEKLYEAYFAENRELADPDVLVEKAVESGFSEDETRELLASDRYRSAVIADEQAAAVNGVHAVPFFVIGKYGVPGAVSTEQMKDILLKAIRDEDGTATIKADGMCDSGECRIR